jgi:glyoxylase-like metal-dependent hydrolase (beta-lactamase superfamily II)
VAEALPVADPWFGVERLDDRITRITEPRVHPIFSANIFLVEGSEADLVIDGGMGVAPLRPVIDGLRRDPSRRLIFLATHTHVDHVGAAHEFETRLVHPVETDALAKPEPYSLRAADLSPSLVALFERSGYPPLWPLLIDAVPWAGYDPDAYRIEPAPATGTVEDGDLIDLGDLRLEVLHLPGHSPGQLGLFEAQGGVLFGADAIYDGPLIWEGRGMDVAAYAASLRRVEALPVRVVHGGHDPSFGPERLKAIVATYLTLWEG